MAERSATRAAPTPRRAKVVGPSADAAGADRAVARLRGLLRTVGSAKAASRPEVLYWAACHVATMLAAGTLPNSQRAAEVLLHAATGNGLAPGEARDAIAKAFATSPVPLPPVELGGAQ